MPPAREFDYVKVDTTPLYQEETGKDKRLHLLWGDRVDVLERGEKRTKARARGRETVGWVDNEALGGESLLELYFIDVGQGDGILIKTPNERHLMVDGGYRRKAQDTGKNAADFVDWKFFKDYVEDDDEIVLEAVLASHCDIDHYGGLIDLLEVDKTDELQSKAVRVETFYHAGIGYWKDEKGERTIGEPVEVDGKKYFTQLVGNRAEVKAGLEDGASPPLQGEWAKLMAAAVATEWEDGTPTKIERLSNKANKGGYLRDFGPGVAGEPAIKVLGPIEFDVNGPALAAFDSAEGQNTNGNSLLLRIDFNDHCRILLTGDLNKLSQAALLEAYEGDEQEFLCDVGKACHHGSADVSLAFLRAMKPAATVISSGDNEGHDHPRANVVAASAISGHEELDGDELISPLIFSTELARSVRIGHPTSLDYKDGDAEETLTGEPFEHGMLHFKETKPGGFPSPGQKEMGRTSVISDLIYGLVNVRTDGEKILLATRDEKDSSWRIDTLRSRF